METAWESFPAFSHWGCLSIKTVDSSRGILCLLFITQDLEHRKSS